jgi:hypothetical protein
LIHGKDHAQPDAQFSVRKFPFNSLMCRYAVSTDVVLSLVSVAKQATRGSAYYSVAKPITNKLGDTSALPPCVHNGVVWSKPGRTSPLAEESACRSSAEQLSHTKQSIRTSQQGTRHLRVGTGNPRHPTHSGSSENQIPRQPPRPPDQDAAQHQKFPITRQHLSSHLVSPAASTRHHSRLDYAVLSF